MTERPIDLSRLKRHSLAERANLVAAADFARVVGLESTVGEFLDSLPDIHAGKRLKDLARAIAAARRAGSEVILGLGPHVLKCGLSPLVIDLMETRVVTAVAMNGAGAIHDFEIAAIGATSEDVGRALRDGSFGMARETAEFFAAACRDAAAGGTGLGAAMGLRIRDARPPHEGKSVLAAGSRLGLEVTVHVAIGTDTVHMHPEIDGAALGAASLEDFRAFCRVVARSRGGVYANVGSAVLLPEVFLKALTVAKNLGADLSGLTTANLDQIQHYRPRVNVLERPGDAGIALTGHHEILLPLLRVAILREMAAFR